MNQWRCLENPNERNAMLVSNSDASGLSSNRMIARISDCDSFYVFANIPRPAVPTVPGTTCDFWCQYKWVVIGLLIGFFVLGLIIGYSVWRLIRYRRKYKEKQTQMKDLQNRAQALDEFHGGLGVSSDEDDIQMMANPLVIQMQELEVQIKQVEENLNLREEQESTQIDQMEKERQRLYAEIQRVREAMAQQQKSGPVRTSVMAPAVSAVQTNMQPTSTYASQATTSGETRPQEFGQVRAPQKKKNL